MNRTELAKSIYNISHLTGAFKLRSGTISNEYFDKYRFEAQPLILKAIAEHLVPLIPPQTQILAGLEMGGIPIATALSLETGIPCLFVRKEAKSYGTCQFAEGIEFRNKNLCVVEDVITTGGQVVESTLALRNEGAIINTVICVIDRSLGQQQKLSDIQLSLNALFTMVDLKSSNS
jgi:orotate phosphoribosyltransferase